VVQPADAPAKTTGKRISEIGGAVVEFLRNRGTGCRKKVLVEHFDGRYTSSAVYREVKHLVEAGQLLEVAGVVGLSGEVPKGAD
jgi:putative DNA primase/helicase